MERMHIFLSMEVIDHDKTAYEKINNRNFIKLEIYFIHYRQKIKKLIH